MAAAAHGDGQIVVPAEFDRRGDLVECVGRTMTAGRRSIIPFQTRRASSYLASSGVITSPVNPRSAGLQRLIGATRSLADGRNRHAQECDVREQLDAATS